MVRQKIRHRKLRWVRGRGWVFYRPHEKGQRGKYVRGRETLFKAKISQLKRRDREMNRDLRFVGRAMKELMKDVRRSLLGTEEERKYNKGVKQNS